MTQTKPIKDITPDEAIDTLRSLIFEYERILTESLMSPLSQDTAEGLTEEYHTALVVLQRYVDTQETNDGDEGSLP